MSLKHGILGLINYGAMTGYELNAAFKESLSFFWKAHTSQIYRELNSMERLGWLTSERIYQTEKPNKRLYSITVVGKEELNKWLSDPDADIRDAMSVRSAFLIRVFLAGEMGDASALKMLKTAQTQCCAAKDALGRTDDAIVNYGTMVDDTNKTKYWKLTVLFGESYYGAMLEWIAKAITIIEVESE